MFPTDGFPRVPGPGHRAGLAVPGEEDRVVCHLDELLARRGMTLVELAARAGVTPVNLSILKNGRARAIRFSTLTAVCDALGCTPGELLTVER